MANDAPQISFEFFPPKTPAGREKLIAETTPALNALGPEYFSCTYGAGGSTREHTYGVVRSIHESGTTIAPHLSFGGDDEQAIGELIDAYLALGVDRLVALRGDMPSGIGARHAAWSTPTNWYRSSASAPATTSTIAVAAYPEVHPQAPKITRATSAT